MALCKKADIIQFIQQNIPKLLAIYAFGSQVQGTSNKNSDLDLAILVTGYADPIQLWQLSGSLADIAKCNHGTLCRTNLTEQHLNHFT